MIRIGLCQINTHIGNFQGNFDKIKIFLKKSSEARVQIAVFPELCISSYPPLDLLDRPDFLEANEQALNLLVKETEQSEYASMAVVIGSIRSNPSPVGKAIQNAAVVIMQGKIVHVQPKRLLPTYDVFDEARYFEAGSLSSLWESPWGKVGLSVCEDVWFESDGMKRQRYAKDPALDLRQAKMVLNISASPFEMNKRIKRQQLLSEFAKRVGSTLVYVNQVGANDEILFDGGSLVMSDQGRVSFEMPYFKEGLSIVDIEDSNCTSVDSWGFMLENKSWEKMFQPKQYEETNIIEILHKGLVLSIQDYFRKTGFKKAVIGLSGGIDSAVVACLAAEALGPSHVIGVSMPSQYSSAHSLRDAELLAKNIGIQYRVHSIKFLYSTLLMELKSSFQNAPADVTEQNMQARLRAIILLALANKNKALLLTTGNKSELAVGYCTTYGDMAGALAPLGDVYKTRVYELAKYLNKRFQWIPDAVLTKPPSAELAPDQKDEQALGSYDVLDRLLEKYFEDQCSEKELVAEGFDVEYVQKIVSLIRGSEFKRKQSAPVLKITSKAFGLGRRMPVAKWF